jgi:DNA-binding Lrp family transcriptional regulator
MNGNQGSKQPEGRKQLASVIGGLTSINFCPQLKTIKLLKLYAENYKIIEVISNQFNPSTLSIAKKLGLSRERTLDILKEFAKVGIIESTKDEKNIHHWSHTKYKGVIIQRLFTEMCNIVENPVYRATPEEISACLHLIKDSDPIARGLGLRALKRLAARKNVGYDPRVIETWLTIIEDPAYDKFKDEILECFIDILPCPLDDEVKRGELGKIDAEKLRHNLLNKEMGELNKIIDKLYSVNVLDALKKYCFNEPFSPGTILLTLTIMRMLNEEMAVKVMLQILENKSLPFHYHNILGPACGLSTPMKEKLIDDIMVLATTHADEEVRVRANFVLTILFDAL